jgi:hypothetical protein
VTYEYGQYDPAGNGFVGSSTTATGSNTTGAGGTIKVNVPLSALGNPSIPVTDSTTLPAVIEPFAIVFAHEEVVSFNAPVERAPDYGFFGASWAVCPNSAPSVSFTGLSSGSTLSAPANLILGANASDRDGTVRKVEFFQGATKLGEDATAPYTFTWANVPAGVYRLTARATDNAGAVAASAPVVVTVSPTLTTNTTPTLRR